MPAPRRSQPLAHKAGPPAGHQGNCQPNRLAAASITAASRSSPWETEPEVHRVDAREVRKFVDV